MFAAIFKKKHVVGKKHLMTIILPSGKLDCCKQTWFCCKRTTKVRTILQTIAAKTAHLSVEIITDKPSSGKISVLQLLQLSRLDWLGSKPSIYVFMWTCMFFSSACWVWYFTDDFYKKNISYFRISSSLNPYQKFRAWSESRLFANSVVLPVVIE